MDLKNDYFLLRHGMSRANDANLIVSRLQNGVLDCYGLTEQGLEQASAAG